MDPGPIQDLDVGICAKVIEEQASKVDNRLGKPAKTPCPRLLEYLVCCSSATQVAMLLCYYYSRAREFFGPSKKEQRGMTVLKHELGANQRRASQTFPARK